MQKIITLFLFNNEEGNAEDTGLLLTRILVLIIIIVIGSLVYLAKDKWFVSPGAKNKKEYKVNKYKDIDGC